jgi:hypothetical protein
VHRDVLGLLDEDWQPRTTLLSPFDNLICDRDRTERLWGFAYHNKMYVPKHKRQFGYYVMPVLSGDQLIGRVYPGWTGGGACSWSRAYLPTPWRHRILRWRRRSKRSRCSRAPARLAIPARRSTSCWTTTYRGH